MRAEGSCTAAAQPTVQNHGIHGVPRAESQSTTQLLQAWLSGMSPAFGIDLAQSRYAQRAGRHEAARTREAKGIGRILAVLSSSGGVGGRANCPGTLVMWGWSFHHGALNVSLPGHEVGISLKQHLPLLITAPNPLWPNITTSTGSAVQQRADFWLSLMCLKYMFSVVLAVALLSWWPWAKKPASDYDSGQVEEIEEELEAFLLIDASNPNDSSDDDCHYDSARLEGEDTAVPAKDVRMATMAVTVAQLMLVTGTTMRATAVDRLTFSNGLCWEAYDLCFTAGLLWYLLQVIALRAIKPSAVFLTVDVAVSSLAFLPFLGDPFDTLKDSILAALAINAGVTMKWQWLSVLGFCGVAYLWLLHSWMLRDPEMEKELQASYVSVLLLKPKAEGGRLAWRPSISQQIWGFLCQQTKSDKQKMLLVEDGPQALLAGAMAFAGALRPVIAWLNLILPSIRLAGSFFLHDYFARKAVPCLFYEAYRNQIAGQTELCQQKVDVLVRICRKELIDFESSWSSKLARIPKELLREVLKDLGFSHHDALPATWPVLKGRWPERDPPPLTCFLTFMIGAQDVDIASCNMHPGVIRDSELYDEFIVRLVRLKGLQELKIRCQDAAHCQRIMVLASAVALVELDLINFADAYWSIGALGAKAVADALVTNETLQKINMAHHDIGPSGATRLANALLANQTLQRLSLGYNGIEDEGCEAFAKMLATNQTLLELYLPVNDIGPTGACALAEALVRNQGLQVLSLSGNEIKDEGAKALAGALVTNTTLQKLYLRKAGLGPAGVASLAKVLASNPSLEVEKGDSDAETRVNDLVDKSNSELYLWANGFGGAGAASLADASATNQTLRNLTLTCDWSGFFPQEDRQIRWPRTPSDQVHDPCRAAGVFDNVVIVTHSDFARTLTPNSNAGTDHGWSGIQMVIGGAVRGGLINPYPRLAEGSEMDAGRGRLIPRQLGRS
eukprot:Skav227401  [mRNA]  locus=scaffold3215:410368:414978:- [translate_table: standard]